MRLVIVRHAKAQERGSVKDDSKRELVPNGVEQAENTALQIKPLVTRCSNVYIWTSPLTRAWQTAKIIEDVLDIHYIQQKDFIESGTSLQLIEEMKQLDGTDCLIVVGHEPNVSEWTSDITGRQVHYKKGQAALLEFKDRKYVEDSLVMLQRKE